MQRFSKVLFSLLFLLALLIVGGVMLGVHFTQRAMPTYEGS